MPIPKVSIKQIKAARELLGWSQEAIAEASGVSLPTIKRLEATGGELGGRPETGEKIIAALEKRPAVMDIPELHAFINSRALPWRPGGVATKTCLPG